MGYRNPYDMDYDQEGELFAYDADMEWDIGSPWYRPTRVVHATSGSEFGWRSGTGKWPTYYADSLPPVVDIGPGSPVGAEFGYGAKFPAKYQKAFYICDWTFGTMYAIHMKPQGSTYVAAKEEFVSRSPLPLTDVAIGKDGAMYFTVGGRGTQSELYRVTYTGKDFIAPIGKEKDQFLPLRELRRELEVYHSASIDSLKSQAATLVPRLLESLGHQDRFIRYAARVALERVPVELWDAKVLALAEPQASIHGMIALAHQGKPEHGPQAVATLLKLKPVSLDVETQLNWHRALQLVCLRLGTPEENLRVKLLETLEPQFPVAGAKPSTAETDDPNSWVYEGFTSTDYLNRELVQILVYLQSKQVVAKTIPLLEQASQQRGGQLGALLERNRGYGNAILAMIKNQPDLQQMSYVFALRNAKDGWSNQDKLAYYRWFQRAHTWSGGASYQKFLDNIADDAYENSTDSQRLVIEASGLRKAYQPPELPKAVGPGKAWTFAEVMNLGEAALTGRDFKNGERAFGAARCVVCHRFVGQGGATGPDLTQAAGRFQLKDLVEAIVDPSKVVSDQYRATQIVTDGGQVIVGRLLNETDKQVTILVDPENSSKVREIPRDEIESMQPSKASLMPAELLNSLNESEVLDLLAYLLSRGDASSAMFKKK
jgi:putative heme-binding domain-containing protein